MCVAGCGKQGFNGDDQLATKACLNGPFGLCVSEDGLELYFADSMNHRIRKVDRNGIISTIAGTGTRGFNGDNRLAITATLNYPTSVHLSNNGSYQIYICEESRIRMISHNGTICTLVGTGTAGNDTKKLAKNCQVNCPQGLIEYKSRIYFCDRENHMIRMIDLSNLTLHTIAGGLRNGSSEEGSPVTRAKIQHPTSLAMDPDTNELYFCDGHRVKKIDQRGRVWTVLGQVKAGFDGDVPFNIRIYPHLGNFRMEVKPFPHAFHDLEVITSD